MLIQEVVDPQGWHASNALVLLFSGSGAGERDAVSYDGDPTGGPVLYIELAGSVR